MAPFHHRGRSRLALAVAAGLLAGCAALAAEDGTRSFDLPGGDAGEALRQFVQQSGSEIMFLSGSLAGVTTAPVRGEFTPREALTRLVSGTDLKVTQDAQTGAFAIARDDLRDRVVKLPPFIVTDSRESLRWKYVSMSRFEILSCCGTRETESFLDEIYRQQSWLDEIVRPDLQAQDTVPISLILFSDDVKRAISENLAVLARTSESDTRTRLAEAGLRISTPAPELMPQVKLWDEDSTGVDIVLRYSGSGGYRGIGFEPDYVYFLLARQLPPLPPWFVEGILYLYQTRTVAETSVFPTIAPGMIGARGGMSMAWGFETGGTLATHQVFSPAPWICPAVADVLKDKPSLPRSLIPIREVLTGPPPLPASDAEKRAWLARFGLGATPGSDLDRGLSRSQVRLILDHGADRDSPWRRDVWCSQVLLFVRWALEDDTFERRQALWNFAAAASTQPVTESLFARCFGEGFDTADRDLAAYLRKAVRGRLKLIPENPIEFPWIELRDATEAEEGRILGDWQRKEFEFVRASHPDYAPQYQAQADRTFRRAYDDGVRDPDFLAALGIFECTVGDDARARVFLEAAVHAGVARPRAYVELARIRLDDALAMPAAPGGKLDAAQVASVLYPLRESRAQLPPQLAAYVEAAQVWEHAAIAPKPADVFMIEEGLRFFPTDSRLRQAVKRWGGASLRRRTGPDREIGSAAP